MGSHSGQTWWWRYWPVRPVRLHGHSRRPQDTQRSLAEGVTDGVGDAVCVRDGVTVIVCIAAMVGPHVLGVITSTEQNSAGPRLQEPRKLPHHHRWRLARSSLGLNADGALAPAKRPVTLCGDVGLIVVWAG